MGEQEISSASDAQRLRSFTRVLLEDVRALERMIDEGLIEADIRRIGAEQEMFLVDGGCHPAPKAMEMLKLLKGNYTTELALFNLEANLPPQVLGDNCLREMEEAINGAVNHAREIAKQTNCRVCLTGILPTLEKTDLTLDNMTPTSRYHELNRVMVGLRGGEFKTMIKGIDELQTSHDNVMMEACNTSFQVHFQVGADEFAELYNLAQVVTAPVLAAAVNSPLLLQHRLWKETRVALFQQSLDSRSKTFSDRGARQRVSFGEKWVEKSVLEIFREDIARFRVLIASEVGESPLKILDRGEIPPLRALCLHNGTVYRWNRACYGVGEGKPHLRIENRVLPAGPTVIDEVANAAFFFGLMLALSGEYGDVTRVMSFDDAKANFLAAARYGLKARFTWVNGRTHAADELILDHLLPLARVGLASRRVPNKDIDRYLGVIEGRVRSGLTGSEWMLSSLTQLEGHGSLDGRIRSVTRQMIEHQEVGEPGHTWPLAKVDASTDWKLGYRTVGQIMTKDLFTVHPDDLVDLAACMMEWEHVRHVPVEDGEGRLVGLVSHRALLRLVADGSDQHQVAVGEIMKPNVFSVTPETTTLQAIELMTAKKVSCLPVTRDGKLVGIVTEADFTLIARDLLKRELSSS